MTHAEMERDLAQATGESIATIRHRGFQLIEPPVLSPLTVDWDEIDSRRFSMLPQRSRSRRPRQFAA